ncbi:hypothetical protein A4X06_0g5348 [Tilletia controversa]|uniref:HAT C-terminal dimerisation domain-containing protein n=1 Tax=Tilletia controversa TaxID=13291 RepID=A0A8X7SWC4_9BASI|nr:hypothetical protein A4X06_0g5348 [Tilletia controversa]
MFRERSTETQTEPILLILAGNRHVWARATFCFGLDQERGQQLLVFARAFGKDETRLASEALYDWIANDQQAFLATEHPAFLRFVKTLRQEYEPPSADTVRRHLMAKYDESKAKLKTHFEGLDSAIALTTDGWTAPNDDPYLCLTGHWITPNWQHRSCLLAFVLFPAPHSAQNAFQLLWDCIRDWGIDRKISACVTDNTATASAYNISTHLQAAVAPRPFHKMRCSAHLLQLAIKHGLADAKTSDILEPLRKFSNTVRRSIPLSQKLKEMCARTGDTYSRPKRDMDVRWNSTYTMLQGLLSMETAIARLVRDDSDLQDVAFSSITWSYMRDIVAILAPFAQATEFLQGLKFSTLGTVAQTVDYLAHRAALRETNASLTAWGNSLALHLGAHLQHYCVHLIDGTATQFATILHPAVKMSLVESYLTDALVPKVPLPTDFWKEKAQRYPALAKMARDLLAIPASTAPSESMFSRGKLLISDRRNSLTSSTVARMMCLDNWLTQFGSSFAA